MNRKGIEFSLRQVEPDLWKWQFQIGDTVTTGQARTRLMGMAARRVHKRIDVEVKKQRAMGRQPGMPSTPVGTVKTVGLRPLSG